MNGMKTIPLDTRTRILAKYDTGKYNRQEVADLFDVSLAFVKKLLSQRKQLGHVNPLYSRAGRKSSLTDANRQAIRELLLRKPSLTLWMIREEIGLSITTQALHVVLGKMGITLKKSHSAPRSKTVKTFKPPVKYGTRI